MDSFDSDLVHWKFVPSVCFDYLYVSSDLSVNFAHVSIRVGAWCQLLRVLNKQLSWVHLATILYFDSFNHFCIDDAFDYYLSVIQLFIYKVD